LPAAIWRLFLPCLSGGPFAAPDGRFAALPATSGDRTSRHWAFLFLNPPQYIHFFFLVFFCHWSLGVSGLGRSPQLRLPSFPTFVSVCPKGLWSDLRFFCPKTLCPFTFFFLFDFARILLSGKGTPPCAIFLFSVLRYFCVFPIFCLVSCFYPAVTTPLLLSGRFFLFLSQAPLRV